MEENTPESNKAVQYNFELGVNATMNNNASSIPYKIEVYPWIFV